MLLPARMLSPHQTSSQNKKKSVLFAYHRLVSLSSAPSQLWAVFFTVHGSFTALSLSSARQTRKVPCHQIGPEETPMRSNKTIEDIEGIRCPKLSKFGIWCWKFYRRKHTNIIIILYINIYNYTNIFQDLFQINLPKKANHPQNSSQ